MRMLRRNNRKNRIIKDLRVQNLLLQNKIISENDIYTQDYQTIFDSYTGERQKNGSIECRLNEAEKREVALLEIKGRYYTLLKTLKL